MTILNLNFNPNKGPASSAVFLKDLCLTCSGFFMYEAGADSHNTKAAHWSDMHTATSIKNSYQDDLCLDKVPPEAISKVGHHGLALATQQLLINA